MRVHQKDINLEKSRPNNSNDRLSSSLSSSFRCCNVFSKLRTSRHSSRMCYSSWPTSSNLCNSISSSWDCNNNKLSYEAEVRLLDPVSLVSSSRKVKEVSNHIQETEHLRVEQQLKLGSSTMETFPLRPDIHSKALVCRSSLPVDSNRNRSHQRQTVKIWVSVLLIIFRHHFVSAWTQINGSRHFHNAGISIEK